ncbi:hypothetical protein KIN20_035446 [Parelaphostrongylus tenuis]|uniref:Uncharacterized protein n=1 Tax=Parelaphostrongylus tenuis TaxID=148309 RepID=A0AAD5RBN7_PARTN|nr:hypothetical protein KIN20_035446 [Parelaphostrongylus tenuis]
MPNLHMMCLAYIANIHAAQYLQQYTSESLVVSSSTADPEMAEKLNRRQGILQSTQHVRFHYLFVNSSMIISSSVDYLF